MSITLEYKLNDFPKVGCQAYSLVNSDSIIYRKFADNELFWRTDHDVLYVEGTYAGRDNDIADHSCVMITIKPSTALIAEYFKFEVFTFVSGYGGKTLFSVRGVGLNQGSCITVNLMPYHFLDSSKVLLAWSLVFFKGYNDNELLLMKSTDIYGLFIKRPESVNIGAGESKEFVLP